MRRKSPETVKIPALNYTKLVFCIIESDARDSLFWATPAVNFPQQGAWDTCSAACVAAFGHRRLQQNAPCSLIKLPGNHASSHAVYYKLPCDFGNLSRVLPSLTRFWQAPAQPCQTAMPYVTLLCSFAKPPCGFAELLCDTAS